MFALVDCNNFYCSCERVFNPALNKRPVVVLSNNDGCVIARSDEAKALGIEMAVPEYMIRDIIKQHGVAVFSSNYTLYGDMSDRVMKLLAGFAPRIELYSIDEAFLDLADLRYTNLPDLGERIRETVARHTGIPITVGIAPTKTLAKLANRYAKKKHPGVGVHWLANPELTRQALENTSIGDIWGIGKQYATLLSRRGIHTAADLVKTPEDWIRDKMSVVGLRLLKELKGTPCLEWEFEKKRRKNICTSRSFGTVSNQKDFMVEALTNHAAACAQKLRREQSCTGKINVFIKTNQFRNQDQQHEASITLQCEVPTSDTTEIIKYTLKGLDLIFQPGHNYQKCGVIVSGLVPDDMIQGSLVDTFDRERSKKLMATLDHVNASLGTEIVRFAVQGFEKRYRLKAEYLSQRFTTNMNEVLHVKN